MLRAKVLGQWRIVSKAMARRFRARGIEVIDTDAVVVPFKVLPGEKVTFPAPAPTPAKPAAATSGTRQTVNRAPVARPTQARPAAAITPPAAKPTKPADEMSLEDLEKLTAPDPKAK